ncbi:DUF7317 family protein [Halegenticoccus tardaugens]|uniref:DUF7317 family protein n=1 Tax=Halegenticoccus tardaugens TaxID=2071624 RepID=UPI00100AD331|nr:UPF0175 family protein [Halegenticoccus tardaugens]
MHTHALTQALTLYQSGTLTFSQAAARAGRSEAEFAKTLRRYGVSVRPEPVSVDAGRRRVGAD